MAHRQHCALSHSLASAVIKIDHNHRERPGHRRITALHFTGETNFNK